MNIEIRKISESGFTEFANKEWDIVNKKHNLLPPKENYYFGVYQDNSLIAYAKIEVRDKTVEIRDILVKDDLTGRGIGTKLLNHIEEWGKVKDCNKVVLKVPSVYDKTIKFYIKQCYSKDATLLKYYYGCDWYYMSKKL